MGLLLAGLLVVGCTRAAPPGVQQAPLPDAETAAAASRESSLAVFMMRNAYHLATLYHAAQAAHWDLAAYEADELEETLEEAETAFPTYAPLLQQYRRESLAPVARAILAQDLEQFRTTFPTAVQGCNDCHVATRRPFILIPADPPQLSIFVLPPVGQ
jgi:hypothetical protein